MCFCHGNRRTNINPLFQFLSSASHTTEKLYFIEKTGSQVTPWIHTDNLAGFTPLGKWTDIHGRMSVVIVGCELGGELFCSNCQGMVNSVGTSMCTNRIPSTDRSSLTRHNNYQLTHESVVSTWTTKMGIWISPIQRKWI